MQKKKIGISYSETGFQKYWDWFSEYDVLEKFELLLLSFEKKNITDIYHCDGFVLTGGVDVTPKISGGKYGYPNQPEIFLPDRDEYESLIYKYAQKQRKPVLGICRGMQYINIMEGGKVFDDNGEAAHLVHKKNGKDKIHPLKIRESSLLHDIVKINNGTVNSAHHQAIDPSQLGHNLMVSAWSDTDDGLIEAIEFADKTDKAFLIGVQWHPERMENKASSPLSGNIRKAFLKAVAGS